VSGLRDEFREALPPFLFLAGTVAILSVLLHILPPEHAEALRRYLSAL